MVPDFDDGSSGASGNVSPVLSATEPSFLDHLSGTGLQACFEFWRGCRQGEHPPLKARIDPVAMPRQILPNLFLYELVGHRFRCRLAGTAIVAAFDDDPTGRYLDDMVSADAVDGRTRLFTGVIERAVPVVYGGQLARTGRSVLSFKRLLLPVSTTGASVDIVFGMVIFPWFEPRTASGRPKDLPHAFEAWAAPDTV